MAFGFCWVFGSVMFYINRMALHIFPVTFHTAVYSRKNFHLNRIISLAAYHVTVKIWQEPGVVGYMPIIPALRRLRQEDDKFEVKLCYTARPCIKCHLPPKKRKNLMMCLTNFPTNWDLYFFNFFSESTILWNIYTYICYIYIYTHTYVCMHLC
jgi:hypothetical protein